MEFETPLCELAFNYGTDKCPQINHSYTPLYHRMFAGRRETIRKVVELGIGYGPIMRNLPQYQTGASLRMWRDFFPNAQIYGADVLRETMFIEDRIKTILCDETRKEDLERLIEFTGPDVDLFIDDGLHRRNAQIRTCRVIMPRLDKEATYVIEDVNHPERVIPYLRQFDCQVFWGTNTRRSDNLIVVRHR